MRLQRSFLILALVGAGCGVELPDGRLRCATVEPRCPDGTFCAYDGRCWLEGSGPVRDLPLGSDCMFAESCASGVCADGVCCDQACGALCASCALAATKGHCSVVADGQPSPAGHPQCEGLQACFGGACSLRGLGLTCTSGDQCGSGICGDGVCCDAFCAPCTVCNAPGFAGTCKPAPAGSDPRGDCSASTGEPVCNTTCDGAGQCQAPPRPCGGDCNAEPSKITPVMQTRGAKLRALACSVERRCVDTIEAVSCQQYACTAAADACAAACTDDLDCSKGVRCSNNLCLLPAGTFGASCTRDTDCVSGWCDQLACRECATNADCGLDTGKPECKSGQCVSSTTCDCATEGLGESCANGYCTSSTATACTHPGRPNYNGVRCVCGDPPATISPPVNEPPFTCGHGEVCSSTDLAGARCVGVAGRPCFSDLACASGHCVNRVCAKAAAGTFCLSSADCTSGVCAPTAASQGRRVCN